jgi:hypothetical protein
MSFIFYHLPGYEFLRLRVRVYFFYFFRFVAFCPRSESSIWYSIWSPSQRSIPSGIADRWTNVSAPSSPVRKPNPFMALYHFTFPFIVCITFLRVYFLGFEKNENKKNRICSFYPKICESLFSFFLRCIRQGCLNKYLLQEREVTVHCCVTQERKNFLVHLLYKTSPMDVST